MRRGMIMAPPFMPPTGLRMPGAPPSMPPMPQSMPTMPQAPPQPAPQGQQPAQSQPQAQQPLQQFQQAAQLFPQPMPQQFQQPMPQDFQPPMPQQFQPPVPPPAQQAMLQQYWLQQALQQQMALAAMQPYTVPQEQGTPAKAETEVQPAAAPYVPPTGLFRPGTYSTKGSGNQVSSRG